MFLFILALFTLPVKFKLNFFSLFDYLQFSKCSFIIYKTGVVSISSTDEQYKILCKIISKETFYKLNEKKICIKKLNIGFYSAMTTLNLQLSLKSVLHCNESLRMLPPYSEFLHQLFLRARF